MSSIDFDAVLDSVGAEGRYQTVLYYLLCIPATIPAAFAAFNQVFLSASPAHWCAVPALSGLSQAQRKALAIPIEGEKYSECSMYHVNYTGLLLKMTSDNGSLAADPTWRVGPCLYGWEYDTSEYDATLVTEVSPILSTIAVHPYANCIDIPLVILYLSLI